MNRKVLFNYLRKAPFGGRLTREQVKGTESILGAFNRRYPDADKRWIAYTLASVFHETGARMAPVRETFADSDRQAIRRLDNAFAQGKLGQVSTPYCVKAGSGAARSRSPGRTTTSSSMRRPGIRSTPSRTSC